MCRAAAIRSRCATARSSSTRRTTRPRSTSRTRSSAPSTSCGREQAGDILVFLSGEREIRETAESLRKHHPQGCEILPLYSRLSQDEQQRVFRPSGRRRVVLSTNVAETSLTVPGIRAVIDTGVARISRYSHRSRLQRLPIEKISQASAQPALRPLRPRRARASPIRLYSEEDFLGATGIHRARDPAHQSRGGDPADACAEARRHRARFRSSSRRMAATCATASARCSELGRAGRRRQAHRHRPAAGATAARSAARPHPAGGAPRSTASSEVAIIASALSRAGSARPPRGQTDPGGPETRAVPRRAVGLPLAAQAVARVDRAARAPVAREAARLVQGELPLLLCGSPNGTTCTARSWKW